MTDQLDAAEDTADLLPETLATIEQSQIAEPHRGAVEWVQLLWARAVDYFAVHRSGLSVTLSLIGILGVAVASLALQDLLVGQDAHAWTNILLVVSLVTGLFFIGIRNSLTHRRGTLYYLRLLLQSMTDTHGPAVTRNRRGYTESRTITRWINQRDSHGSVLDFSRQVSEIAAELERSMNNDTSTTGYHIAPNLLWPAALAVGYNTYWRDETDLVELPVELPKPAGAEPNYAASETVEWRIGVEPAPSAEFSTPTCTRTPVGAGTEVTSVLIIAELTDMKAADRPAWPADAVYRIAAYATGNAQSRLDRGLPIETREVEVDVDAVSALRRAYERRKARDSIPEIGGNVKITPAFEDFRAGLRLVHPQVAARVCFDTVRQALHAHPQAMIMLAFRVPKTVAFTIGALLAQDGKDIGNPGCGSKGCRKQSCRDPWSRLVPLLYSGDPTNPYVIARVHESQPSKFVLAARYPEKP